MSRFATPPPLQAISVTSTPSSIGEQPLCDLTPRTKVKAMLAALDNDDSDGDEFNTNGMLRSGNGIDLEGLAECGSQVRTVAEPNAGNGHLEDDEDGDSDGSDIVIPRGKLAARLHGTGGTNDGPTGPADGISIGTSAYDRIKQQLLSKSTENMETSLEDKEQPIQEPKFLLTRKFLQRKKQRLVAAPDGSESPSKSLKGSESRSKASSTPRAMPYQSHTTSRSSSPSIPHDNPVHASTASTANASKTRDEPDSDFPKNPQPNSRFLALVAKKREEREAKAAAEEKKRVERYHVTNGRENISSTLSDDEIEDDSGAENKLTQQTRPARKASKKAIEEINRETQRMSRNMQLAHQAKTKKKVTKESLLARFNFRPIVKSSVDNVQKSSTADSSAPVSDVDAMKDHETPPTSPSDPATNQDYDQSSKETVFIGKAARQLQSEEPLSHLHDMDGELPSMQEILDVRRQPLSKGKGRADDHLLQLPKQDLPKSRNPTFAQPPIRVKAPKRPPQGAKIDLDSDDEVESKSTRRRLNKRLGVFDKLEPKKISEGKSLQTLRALAHLTSPSKSKYNSKGNMTPAEMHFLLQRRARQQAAKDRAERLQDLRNRGVIIQTIEERQRDQMNVEDLLEKARREGEELTKKENADAKRERKDNVTERGSSDDDGDYKEATVEAVEFSGSEDEADDEDQEFTDEEGSLEEDEDDEEDASGERDNEGNGRIALDNQGLNGVVRHVDHEGGEENQLGETDKESKHDIENDEINEQLPNVFHHRRHNKRRIVDDDDDEGDSEVKNILTAKAPNLFAPNLPGSNNAPMGLTQAFAATMAETQTQMQCDFQAAETEQGSGVFSRNLPDPDFPMIEGFAPESIVPDSQTGSQSGLQLEHEVSQSQMEHDTFPTPTQYSDIPDPTQDAGFQALSPVKGRFVSDPPPSTIDTVLLTESLEAEMLVTNKRGRLQRRTDTAQVLSDAGPGSDEDGDIGSRAEPVGVKIAPNAFEILKKVSTKPGTTTEIFDKKKSEAKGMVEEQAEESEDEYAGLGGASDDDSMAEEDEEVRKMMDDGEVKVDERKLAAFYADKERASDEKAIEKLYKDINNGGLRRKRGAGFDLSDSDDDIEARRKIKRREFAKMRKALLENENVGKIAEDPKKLAFLRAIEDREDDDDDQDDFLDQPEDTSQPVLDSQDFLDSQTQTSMPRPTASKRKRPLEDSVPDRANRPPPHTRRTQQMKKPATLAEIRESVSFLIEEPQNYAHVSHSDSSEGEGQEEQEQDENDLAPAEASVNTRRDPFTARRTTNPIIDRLSLARASSSLASTTSSTTRLAFHDPNALPTPGFKVPSLLRRATTQLTADTHGITTATANTERAAGGGEKGDFVRRGGTKRSSINYFARESERSKGVKDVERRKEEGRRQIAEGRRGMLGVLGSGKWGA